MSRAVEPNHRPVAVIAVVVPRPGGGRHEIPLGHGRALAVHGGVGAVAFYDEAQRRLRMAVGGSDLTRQHQLKAGVERGRDPGTAAQPGIFKHQDPPLRLLGGDDPARTQHLGAHIRIPPMGRAAGARRLRRDHPRHDLPQRGEVLPRNLPDRIPGGPSPSPPYRPVTAVPRGPRYCAAAPHAEDARYLPPHAGSAPSPIPARKRNCAGRR